MADITNYNIYRNLKSELVKKTMQLSELQKSSGNKFEIESLEVEIEENINGLNMVFDNIISQKR